MAEGRAEAKTQPTGASVEAFVDAVEPERRREDAWTLLDLMRRATGEEPVMWGPSIIGFGRYTLTYADGRVGDWPAASFSPRKAASTIYLLDAFEGREELLSRLGPHTTGKVCVYVKRVSDLDLDVLEDLVRRSYRAVATS